MLTKKSVASFLVAFSVAAPAAAFAKPVTGIVDTSAETVSKINFLSWSFLALDIPKEKGDCKLPYARVARGLRATLCTSQTLGALEVLGTGRVYTLNEPITRGEAIIALTAILDRQSDADVSAFRDVKSAAETQAVKNAIADKWMVPASATNFGLKNRLTGSETLSLLQAASGELPDRVQNITVTIGSGVSGTIPEEELMSAIWGIIERDYLKSDSIDKREAAYKAIEGLVDSLNDPYTNFFRPASAEDFQSQIKGELSGIGAQIEDKEGIITIVAPLPGSPAEKAGLTAGDQILEANDVKLTGLGSERAVTYIRGERGTTVKLKIKRGGTEFTVSVVREVISIPEIAVAWQGDIAVVTLSQFGETTQKQIRSIFTDIQKQNPRGVVLDLRNNGGGLLSAADTVMSNFVPKGSVVAQVKSRTSTYEEKTQDEPTLNTSTKVAVLVNKGSASASEIVSGALQDMKRATVIGTQTFGKGTVQEVIGFRSGEALKLTIAEWLTPKGRHIEGIGVKPDVIVDSEDRDVQLKRALDILR
jgi:carboxyl-terminal processing protease